MGEIANRLAEANAALADATRKRDVAKGKLGDALAFGSGSEIADLEKTIATHAVEIERFALAVKSLSIAVRREQFDEMRADEARLREIEGAAAKAESDAKIAYNAADKALLDAQLAFERAKNEHYNAHVRALGAYERAQRFAQEHASELAAAEARFAVAAGR